MEKLKTNLDLFLLIKDENSGELRSSECLVNLIKSQANLNLTDNDIIQLRTFANGFCKVVHKKWTQVHRTQERFLLKNSDWLQSEIKWPNCVIYNVPSTSESETNFQASGSGSLTGGPPPLSSETKSEAASPQSIHVSPRKPFEDLGPKQKRRRTQVLEDFSTDEIYFVWKKKMKAAGQGELVQVFDHLIRNPDDIQKTKNALIGKKSTLDRAKALALSTTLNLSKWQYNTLRASGIEETHNFLPSYKQILQAKQECYPAKNDIIINEKMAKLKLQSVLDITVRRLLYACQLPDSSELENLVLVSKWGFDGASGQSNYKQRFSESVNEEDDSSVFMTSFVPLKLTKNAEVLWENPRPSSTHYCRPIKFEFIQESSIVVKKELQEIEDEISNLHPTVHGNRRIEHQMHMTMIDGKICSIISDTPSSATCTICLAKPSQMNNIDALLVRPVREDLYKYGLSTLHMWIRCLECMLHVAYNQDFKKWAAHKDDKSTQQTRKAQIQKDLRQELGINVDIVKRGSGTSNDGNTARRFFSNYQKSASITGLDEDLLKRFAVILQAISSGKKINTERFDQYAKETAKLFVSKYTWYYMPASIHKLLIHGADICTHYANIPIGQLSEEAAEARNKEFRNVREWHTRKLGRKETNEDILHNFLISSDPYISHIRPRYEKKTNLDLLPEAKEMVEIEETQSFLDDEEETYLVTEVEKENDPLGYF